MQLPALSFSLIAGEETLTGESLSDLLKARAAELRAQGVREGQVVLVPDRPACDLAILALALNRIGAGIFPYRADLTEAERQVLTEMTGAEWSWEAHAQRPMPLGPQAHSSSPYPSTPVALLIRTSGSGGQPKIAMHGPSGVIAAARLSNAALEADDGTTWLCCLRLSHIAGAAIVYRAAVSGARLVLHDGFDAEAVAADLVRHQVTHLSLVPPMLARLLELGANPAASLRCALVGGQALSPELAQRASAAGWPIQVSYGLTETCALIALAEPADPDRFLPLPGVELMAPACPKAAPIALRTPSLMLGYANPKRQPGVGLDRGWLKIADLGCLEPAGWLHLFGRADDVCAIGGTNVSLRKVTHRLAAASGVIEAEVVALPDPVWGARLIGVYSGALDEEGLARWCERELAGPERPRAFIRLEGLPRLDSGKVDRQRITQIAQRLLGH
ncbi:AMP-binding protein [Caldichromatium japonicum]|uniref:AMP-binding protein n=1 Tax=Caldichromatium japonicum TaxID=2699430 RepID=A0A6G7VEZ3_9GAMM|nr:AMP-binding protein [Caldichromatium japonicum]QIK38522.1 AMP-binding protein [Caldichromatium japonicum]